MNMSIKPLPIDIIELLESKFKIDPVFTEKDWYTQHVLGVIAKFESDEFQPIFSGGTSLSKGYQLIQRFSEDIDFRVRPLKENLTRSYRSNYQDRLVEAILASSSDLQLVREVYKRDRSTFLTCQIAYPSQFTGINTVRPHIQVELTFEPPQLKPEIRPLSSLINQFTQQPPEIAGMACLNLAETAADKLAALSWRVASKEPNSDRYDPRIIRHLYDLSYLSSEIIDNPNWSKLSLETISNDLKTRDRMLASQIGSPQELLNQLVDKLGNNSLYREHYRQFVEEFTYGESLSFDEAIASLSELTARLTSLDRSVIASPSPTQTQLQMSQKPKSLADLSEPEVEADSSRPTEGLLYELANDPDATRLKIDPDDPDDLSQEDGLSL
jgi:predicted nucleotidyltransferase component of viral defense system